MSVAETIWRGIIAWREPAAGMLWERLEKLSVQLNVTYASLESLDKRLRNSGYYQFLYISPLDWRTLNPQARRVFARNVTLVVLGPEVAEQSDLVDTCNSVFLKQAMPLTEVIESLVRYQRCLIEKRTPLDCMNSSQGRVKFIGDAMCLSGTGENGLSAGSAPHPSEGRQNATQPTDTEKMSVRINEMSGISIGDIHASGDLVVGGKNVYHVHRMLSDFESVSERPGIPEYLYNHLCKTLLECGPFHSDADLRALFVNSSISAWYNTLPEAPHPAGRVQRTVSFLYRKHNQRGECALVLLLRLLRDNTNPSDICHSRLSDLIDWFESL
jgi:hypothetical protein